MPMVSELSDVSPPDLVDTRCASEWFLEWQHRRCRCVQFRSAGGVSTGIGGLQKEGSGPGYGLI